MATGDGDLVRVTLTSGAQQDCSYSSRWGASVKSSRSSLNRLTICAIVFDRNSSILRVTEKAKEIIFRRRIPACHNGGLWACDQSQKVSVLIGAFDATSSASLSTAAPVRPFCLLPPKPSVP